MGIVALAVFSLLRLTPGDPAAIIAGDTATPEQLERVRASLGLDEPILTQFVTWIGHILHGDFGVSLISQVPVMTMIGQRLEPTISIALCTMTFAILVGLGARRARRSGVYVDLRTGILRSGQSVVCNLHSSKV